jgi:peptide/nickel transport system permease protein
VTSAIEAPGLDSLSPPLAGRLTRRTARLARTEPVGFACGVFLIAVILAAIFAHSITPYGPLDVAPLDRLKGPSSHHIFGTDAIGRDVFSRVVYGARISLIVGFSSVAIGVSLGSIIGIVTGFLGGYTDIIAQRILDTLMSIPGLLLALVIAAILGVGTKNTIIPIAVVQIPLNARVVRSSVLSLKERQFIEAARVIGCGRTRIMWRHITPNVMAPIIVLASVLLGSAIIIEASLSFLGLGTPPPNPSWGNMLSGSGQSFLEQAPWIGGFPGIAITAVVLAVNLLGDTLRDALDPRMRGVK